MLIASDNHDAKLSLSRGLAKCTSLESLTLTFQNTWTDIAACSRHVGCCFSLPVLKNLQSVTIAHVADAPQRPLLESLASLPSLNTLRLFFWKRVDIPSHELARIMSQISLRTFFSDATTLCVEDLRAILAVSPSLQYVNIEAKKWQHTEYNEFVDFLAHGRHVCIGHDDPLGGDGDQWHDQFFYVVTRESYASYDDDSAQGPITNDSAVRNVNGVERKGGRFRDQRLRKKDTYSATGAFPLFGC